MPIAQTLRQRFSIWRETELRPNALGASVLAAVMIYVLGIIIIISFAALIFSGTLSTQLPKVLGFIVIGNALLCALIAVFSSYPGSIGISQDAPVAVLSVVAASIVAALPALAVEQQFATVVAMIVMTTMLTGAILLALGFFKLGGLARFLPYPVMGGFLAGTGWLLAKGGIGVMVTEPFGLEWTDSNAVTHWLPGVVVGIILFVAVKRINKPVAIPTILAIAAIVFYVTAIALNVSLAQLEAGNWVLGMVPSDTLWQFPLSGEIVAHVNWSVLISELPNLAPIPIVCIIALLLNSGGLELVVKRDIDLNRELVAAGISNLAVGPFAGLTGYQAISLSALNFTVSGGKRLVGIIIALLIAVTIVLGTAVLAYIPKFILGAILIYLGIALLAEWVFEAWSKFPRLDFAIIVVILGVIMVRGFLEGIIVGLVLAIILFAISYSRVGIVKYGLFGGEYNSRFTRAPSEQEILERQSDQLYVLKLQGFIFFGTANSIYDQVRAQVNVRANPPIRFVLLDFALVTGLDSTGLLSFNRMLQWCQERRIMLGLTGLNGRAREQFVKGGFDEQPRSLQFFSDLDHGVEWCEQQILSATRPHPPGEMNLTNEFTGRGDEFGDMSKFARHLRRQEFAAGEYLFQQGDEAGSIFFVESGQVTAQIESNGKAPMRLETMCSGRVVGELGFFLDIRRTASVIADQNSVVYSLSKPELLEMEQNDPEAANAFHRLVIHLLGERVVHLVRTVNALER